MYNVLFIMDYRLWIKNSGLWLLWIIVISIMANGEWIMYYLKRMMYHLFVLL